jgi:prevent-host-death family protein
MKDRAVINIHHAKTHLSSLLTKVAGGQEVIIAKAGTPIAKLVPLDHGIPLRKPGFLKGKITLGSNFNAPLPDELQEAFENPA